MCLLFVFAVLVLWTLFAGESVRSAPRSVNPDESDMYLYIEIAERVTNGAGYYESAVLEQISRGYPVQPATTIRTPTTTMLVTTLGPTFAFAVMCSLIGIVLISALFIFEVFSNSRISWILSILLLVSSFALFGPQAIYFQETWAVLMMILSIFASRRSLGLAIVLALIACAFRELALPFVFAMALFELLSNRVKRAIAWICAGAVYLAGYSLHIWAATRAVDLFGSGDVHGSPGWFAFGGWPFIVGSVRSVTVLSAFPLWISALIVPLALLGWLFIKNEIALRFSLAVLGFVVPFLIIGRPNNNYWGLLYAAMLLPGLAFGWRGLRTLALSAVGKTDSTSVRD